MWTAVIILEQVLWVIAHLSKEPCIIILIRWEGILECCVFMLFLNAFRKGRSRTKMSM